MIGTCYSIKNTGIEGAKLNAKDCHIQELSEKATRSAICGGLAGQKHSDAVWFCVLVTESGPGRNATSIAQTLARWQFWNLLAKLLFNTTYSLQTDVYSINCFLWTLEHVLLHA